MVTNSNSPGSLIQPEQIEQAVLLIRDLAALYGVTTGNLNKAVQRNAERFPADFMFQLTADEAEALRFHFGSLKRGQHYKYLPYAFTQEGVAMLSSMLRSPRESHSLSASTGERILRIQIRALSPRTGARSIAPRSIHGPDQGEVSIWGLPSACRRKRAAKSAFTPFPRTLPIRAKRKPNANEARRFSINSQDSPANTNGLKACHVIARAEGPGITPPKSQAL
jgi:hypothetical protein